MSPEEQLIAACAAGRLQTIQKLVEAGVPMDISGRNGPLISAVIGNHPSCVLYLLSRGANVDIGNENRSTPLIFAAFAGNTEIGNILLQAGANRDVINAHGKTAAHYAQEKGASQLLAALTANPEQVTYTHRIADRNMQEIFDFKRKERVTLIRKDDGAVEAVLRDSFQSLDDTEGLRHAFNEHKRIGGKMSEEEVFGQAIAKAKKLTYKPQ